ncbi:RND transporter [Megasphaera cerevisiae DSM 20462]|jgi:membrane fusion protein (multidrug efflux system)|uniref:RND transporter n=1 Tax=Megasphaera cerevisiae DSM 20462 TaxID=1122219 RepID=A0A0J6ZS99_9FIRM|nr:efflux RND transporter periplasmic adaptor subunit [Megasphaera cerevisiae]KMO87836.1 RND transporter [Megasphaera cerevisiae DSM 20462]MCI1750168.1 efflux RND transporter periplasmic adaptor subunit [Megasphaera cerevisiae]SJZ41279.1 membrane fusion protein, multidrug efflux system [Megasphaera cerevisiae DSM 20462]
MIFHIKKKWTLKKPSRTVCIGVIILLMAAGLGITKYGSFFKQKTAAVPQAVEVRAMRIAAKDTPVDYEFVGKVVSKNEISIMSKISGNIINKMVKGGDIVYQGQPLFQIDDKQYQSKINAAKGTLSKDKATLQNTQRDLARYRALAQIQGVSQQTVDSYEAQAEEEQATVDSDQASLDEAQQDEQDTLILSPVDGKIDVNDLSVGQYITAGSSTLATVSSLDPIWVQYSISENEYIRLSQEGQASLPENFKNNLKLILSDGSEYPLRGQIDAIDKGISTTTGTLTIKAVFDNPQHFLIPGMFAKIVAAGEVRKNALLVPQQSVKDLLDNSFVYVITADNTIEARKVTLGPKVGNMVIIDDGVKDGEAVVVDDVDKVKDGAAVAPTFVTADQFSST